MDEQELIRQTVQNAGNKKTLHLLNYESEVCPECGSKLFTTAFVIKNIPGYEFGRIESKTLPMPIENFPVYVCAKCGALSPTMLSDPELKKVVYKVLEIEEETEEETPKSALIV